MLVSELIEDLSLATARGGECESLATELLCKGSDPDLGGDFGRLTGSVLVVLDAVRLILDSKLRLLDIERQLGG